MFSGSSIDAPQKDFPILDGRSAKIRQQLLAEGKEPQPHSFEALGLEAGGALKLLTKARHQPEEGQGPGGWCAGFLRLFSSCEHDAYQVKFWRSVFDKCWARQVCWIER